MNLGIYYYINKPLCKAYYINISISTIKNKKEIPSLWNRTSGELSLQSCVNQDWRKDHFNRRPANTWVALCRTEGLSEATAVCSHLGSSAASSWTSAGMACSSAWGSSAVSQDHVLDTLKYFRTSQERPVSRCI